MERRIRRAGPARLARGSGWHALFGRWIAVGLAGAAFLALAASAAAAPSPPLAVTLGSSVAALDGPWRFHLGDDPRWADPAFDDARWETVDLTPKPGAHDSDVGLSGYVPGWNARGHRGYSGYAWYRIRVRVAAPPAFSLAMTGPPSVDSAYQAFFDGRLLGGSGVFRGPTPTVFGPQPRRFLLPRKGGDDVIAIRVWAGPGRIAGALDAGGIHIAPAIGEAGAIGDRYLLQWRQTLLGYAVDVVPGVLLLGLAVMAASLAPFAPEDRVYPWLSAALLLIATIRFNQAVFTWAQIEPVQVYGWITRALATPLSLGAWTMAWLLWFRIGGRRWIASATGLLTIGYMLSVIATASWSPAFRPTPFTTAMTTLGADLRLGFVGLYLLVAGLGAAKRGAKALPGLFAMLIVGIGLFAGELSTLHIQGIWFPYGVGLSRTEIAYVALTPMLFGLLLGRLLGFAGRLRARGPAAVAPA